VRLGFNYRLDDVSAALGIAQLEKLDEILTLRREVAARYDELLRGIDGVELPFPDDADHVRSWFVYVVKLPSNDARERVIAHFEREGIGFNRYLPSIHLQPYMRERYGFREGMCPISEDASSRTLALPFFTALGRDAQERVADALATAL
jgi:dTDP-4-amino-4,6-dideoxygalactose transaminase